MRDRSKILIIIAAVILCAAMLSACGAAPQNEATAAEPAAVPSSTVEPTPEPEPELPAGCAVTVDGMGLSGSVVSDGVTYVSAAEFFGALDLEYSADGGALNFVWRTVEMSVGGDGMQLLTYRGETYVPVNELCGEMGISLLVDDEYDHLYCTPAAGDWILPGGVQCSGANVPLRHGRCCLAGYAEGAGGQPGDDGSSSQVSCGQRL